MIKGRKVYDPLTNTWSTGYWVVDDKGNYYPLWQKGAGMERLTKVMSCPNGTKIYDISNKLFGLNTSRADKTRMILEKLAEYEDLEEQGRIIKLPCKVGDTVWDNDYGRPCAYTITAFSFGECEEYICEPVTTKEAVFYYANSSGSITGSFAESEIGKSVFLNESEAEAKLKELRGGENER